MHSSFPARRCAALLLLLPLGVTSCNRAAAPAPSTAVQLPEVVVPQTPAPAGATDEDQTLLAVSKALRQAGLLTHPDQCYAYRFNPAPTQLAFEVNVMENHSHPECGGDPQTEPHVLTARVDKKTHVISHDAHDPGNFVRIQP